FSARRGNRRWQGDWSSAFCSSDLAESPPFFCSAGIFAGFLRIRWQLLRRISDHPARPEDKLRQGQTCRVLIRNWHKLDWETEEQIRKKRSVDKRGPKRATNGGPPRLCLRSVISRTTGQIARALCRGIRS